MTSTKRKSIKKFFKWIADHTGISWIARKISSCWKSGNKTNQAGGTSQPRSQVPSESQVNGTAINGIVIPEGAKLVFSPELSDFLLRERLEMAKQLIKMGANSPAALEEQTDREEEFFDAEENQPWLPNSEATESEVQPRTAYIGRRNSI